MKKFLLYFSIFLMIGTITTVVGLTIIDDYIYTINNSSSTIISTTSKTQNEEIAKVSTIKLEDNISLLDFSYNNKYYTYLKDNKIYINSTDDAKKVDTVEEKTPIVYYKLLYDKNLIIYFTEEKNGNYSTLLLHTYEISQKRKAQYAKINVYNFSKIKNVDLSPIINIIYIDVEIKNGNRPYSKIYKVNLFNDVSTFASEIYTDKTLMLQQKDRLYYQDKKSGNIYYSLYQSWSRLNIFKDKVSMIGLDTEDDIYFLNEKTKKQVYKVANNKIVDTIELTDTDIVDTYSNHSGVYLIYPNYIINVASKDKYARVGRVSKFVTLEAIKDDVMYVRTGDNQIIQRKLIAD